MSEINLELDPITKKNVELWLSGDYDEDTKSTINQLMKENPKEVIDAFYTKLSFGTGGLRGIMGIGTNRINIYTIRAATQGLVNYLNKQPKPESGYSVIIGYDSRHNSRLFAEESAKVLAGNHIRVYLFNKLRPTPLISFGCRLKKCSAAIMITASHNPAEYNGYKVYWSDGGQVLPPHDKAIIEEVSQITDVSMIKKIDDISHPLIEHIEHEIDEIYYEAITLLQHYPEENHHYGQYLKVVYTSLHGTGITLVPETLKRWGFTNLLFVEPQIVPDGDFPTSKNPNPEEPEALKLGIEKLERSQADLLIATDPDADRIGIAVKHQGKVHLLNGNQIACIFLEHICNALTSQNRMPERAAFVKTIGTTELFKTIATSYGRPCFDVLTGFKYIVEKIRQWEENSQGYQYVFGGEESYGYLLGTHARDKDAVVCSALICEVALHAKRQNKTVIDLVHDLYKKHGVYIEKLHSIRFEESKEGQEQMAKRMAKLEDAPPRQIHGIDIIAIEDYKRSIKTNIKNGETLPITLPKSSVLLFWLADGSKLMIRPSGTEPKIKIYCGVVKKEFISLPEALKECENHATHIIQELEQHL